MPNVPQMNQNNLNSHVTIVATAIAATEGTAATGSIVSLRLL
jgi:hypothetical protein